MTNSFEDRIVRKFKIEHLKKFTRFPIIVIYKNPSDYPDKYVARVWNIDSPTALIALAESLEEIRKTIPDEMYNLGRNNEDDPCIVEAWI